MKSESTNHSQDQSFRRHYQEMMQHVQVDAEMTERVLAHVAQADLQALTGENAPIDEKARKKADREKRVLRFQRYVPVIVAAAIVVIVVIAVPWNRGSKTEMATESAPAAAAEYEEAAAETAADTYEEAASEEAPEAYVMAEAPAETDGESMGTTTAGNGIVAEEQTEVGSEMTFGTEELSVSGQENFFLRLIHAILHWIRSLFG